MKKPAKPSAAKSKERPFLAKGNKSLNVTAETIFGTVKAIIDAGQEEQFLAECKMAKATVRIAPKFVNLVKNHLFDNGVHRSSVAARSAVQSDRCQAG